MLIVISHSELLDKEEYYIEKLLSEGVDFFHLRKPSLSEKDIQNLIKKIPNQILGKVTLHNNFQLLDKFELGGIHFSSDKKNIIKSYQNSGLRLSTSCHSFDEIDNLPGYIDYTFLSPVFNSISKENYNGRFENNKTKAKLCNNYPFKVIALGGIDETNINKVSYLGFDGAAMLGRIWSNPDDLSIVREIKKYV